MKNLISMTFVAIFLSVCNAYTEDIDLSQSIRMNQLLPQDLFSFSLGIEPKLPDNFVCMKCDQRGDFGAVYWGPAEVLQAFQRPRLFNSADYSSRTIIRRHSRTDR